MNNGSNEDIKIKRAVSGAVVTEDMRNDDISKGSEQSKAADLATLKRLGQRLQKRRLELGLSQEDLCRLAGTNRTYISDIERGVTNVSFIVLKKLSRALRTDVAEITRGLDDEESAGQQTV